MQKVIMASTFQSIQSALLQNYHSSSRKSLISWITAYSTFSQNKASSSEPNAKNSVLADYLVSSLNFSKDKAFSISSNFLHDKYLEKPEQVVHFFGALGFSDVHIRSIAHRIPRILFADIERTLKPKIAFFQELGLSGPALGSFISRTPYILNWSLDRSLKPSVRVIKNIFASDGRNRSIEMVNDDLFRTIARCARIVPAKHPLEANIAYLRSCGIVGSQLSSLLYRQPRIFILPQDKLAEIVSRAVGMNFSMGSKMLVHAIHSLSCMRVETLNGKFEVLMEFGFSKEEVDPMFRKSPYVFGLSGAKLKRKLELLVNDMKIDRLMVVKYPAILTLNIEGRVIPRYKVLEILKSRGVLKKDPSWGTAMALRESKFLQTYVVPFETGAQELLSAYNPQFLNN